ncbi:MAG TPA: SDR family NAD(P)-dependent oxidoreductase [Polyangiaceae bacterium]|nr:SDR family NAD(P)-dependent oxidoreductase [Polyangiaceae bacterium]
MARSIFVTGASSGLGAGLARIYAEPGTTIGLLGRDRARLEAVANEVRARGARAWVGTAELEDCEAIRRALGEFVSEAGRLDVVIANAGVGQGPDAERFDPSSARQIIDVNVLGLTNTLLAAVPTLIQQGHGTLVGMSSLAGFGALPGSLTYSASKAYVRMFCDGLRLELAGTGVDVVTLCPGFVRTPLTDKNDFAMPFLLECDDACRRMRRAIDRKRRTYVFPWPLSWVARATPWLPDKLLLGITRRAQRAG